MPKIKVEVGTATKDEHGRMIGQNARLWMDGQEIHDIREIGILIPLDDVVRMNVEVLATDKLEFVGEAASMTMILRPMPGYELVVTKDDPEGKTVRFKCIPETTKPTGEVTH